MSSVVTAVATPPVLGFNETRKARKDEENERNRIRAEKEKADAKQKKKLALEKRTANDAAKARLRRGGSASTIYAGKLSTDPQVAGRPTLLGNV